MTHEEIISELKQNESWMDAVCQTTQFKSHDVLKMMMDKFNVHLVAIQQEYGNKKDFAQHFVNWLRKQPLQTIKIEKPKDAKQDEEIRRIKEYYERLKNQ